MSQSLCFWPYKSGLGEQRESQGFSMRSAADAVAVINFQRLSLGHCARLASVHLNGRHASEVQATGGRGDGEALWNIDPQ